MFRDFINLLYPPACKGCGSVLLEQECFVCTCCLYNMARTNFHTDPENPMAQVFWGRVYVESAAAMYYFEKGSKCRKILHQIKYRGQKEMAFYFGSVYASDLFRAGKFTDTDIIVPVPLHADREKKRGFNQSEWFARGLAAIFCKPVIGNVLVRHTGTETQTSKSRRERWENVKNSFSVSFPDEIENRHVLLVDDVVTTGATLESCAIALLKNRGVRISILTFAYA
jgi:ComF family protein